MRHRIPRAPHGWGVVLVFAALLASAGPGRAQGTTGPTVADSKVGYIDPAIPGNVVRFRFDAGYDFRRPTRAEFFYPRPAPFGPGLPEPERRIDYQEPTIYGEYAVTPGLSLFVEQPFRLLNPDINDNSAGPSDLNAGFKWAFLQTDQTVASFQLRTYAPTGDASRGLGTRHVTLEPALLLFRGVDDRLSLAGELRYWVPIGGTDFAGDIIRYGAGVQYDLSPAADRSVVPVVEVVGWTVLGGKESILLPTGRTAVESAAGDTIVNLKLGVRFGLGENCDLYAGWGRPLTGERWYHDIARFELRFWY